MNRLISQKFRFYSFISITLLLYVHGYNLKEAYLSPFSLINEPLTFTTYIEYFLANGVLRFRLPLLFLISGYIFALQDSKPYGERIQKRFVTLIIPYLFWSAMGLAVTFLWQQFPVTADAVYNSQLDQLGDNRPYSEMHWSQILLRWVWRGPAFQLWFIRSLFIYNVMYPVIKWAVLRYPKITFGLLFLCWIRFVTFYLVESQGIFFYAMGIWLCKTSYPIQTKPSWYGSFPAWLLFIGLSVTKTFMAFELDYHTPLSEAAFSFLHIASVSAGVLAVWFSGDALVIYLMQKKWVLWLVAFSFIIYAFHVPLLPYTTQLAYRYLDHLPYYRLITYLTVPLLIFGVCVAFGALLRSVAPAVYRIATGGRGF